MMYGKKKTAPKNNTRRKTPIVDAPTPILCATCTTPDTCTAQGRCRKSGRRLETI
jgi:hypothetical protein